MCPCDDARFSARRAGAGARCRHAATRHKRARTHAGAARRASARCVLHYYVFGISIFAAFAHMFKQTYAIHAYINTSHTRVTCHVTPRVKITHSQRANRQPQTRITNTQPRLRLLHRQQIELCANANAHLGTFEICFASGASKKNAAMPAGHIVHSVPARHHAPLLCVLAASRVLAPCPLSLIRALLLQLRFFFLLVSAFPSCVLRNSSSHTPNKSAF